jgi:serine/threonine protein kinase
MSLPAPRAHDDAKSDDEDRDEGSSRRRRDPSIEIELEGAAELAPVAQFAGYEVLGRLAVGGMAELFLARERGEGGSTRLVALKVIRGQLANEPELAQLFLQEGRVAMGLTHPNVCHTLRFGTEHGHPFLAMELVVGVTLRDLFARARRAGKPLAPAVAAKIASSVAEALHSAHVAKDARGRALGIVHQDVSPHNVMVAYDGTVKLLDFGVASTSKERAIEAVESSHVTVRGKTAYLSPEQVSGVAVDGRSDVFSLGIVLFEMLTGSRLFARAQSLDTMRAIAAEPLPLWPPSIPPQLQRVLDRALAQDRGERYESAAAMQEGLELYLAETRSAVTSAKIAKELERLLGEDYGKPPVVDRSSEGVAWLRSEAETICEPIPLVNRRPTRALGRGLVATLGAIAIAALAAVALYSIRSTVAAPESIAAPVDVAATDHALLVAPVRPPETAPSAIPSEGTVAAAQAEAVRETSSEAVRRPRPRPRRHVTTTTTDEPSGDFVDDPGF